METGGGEAMQDVAIDVSQRPIFVRHSRRRWIGDRAPTPVLVPAGLQIKGIRADDFAFVTLALGSADPISTQRSSN